ncbi:uncharacterized protein VICG_01040 [Vittaforma corneae ATCC 50505]|uniref:Uncharacterized protein n=1 Tax=Vittaforma corneae (strain ATCC 50505) TaxID=993615 RepID=L2GLY2_VITCO|nr:uncharacterized protein VICG_01040 [Vittaforma corneae ATCC 50505]ELA41856.1 hypothetical protein VICG_01040 [Vittaforma corneae ATCC 50505]
MIAVLDANNIIQREIPTQGSDKIYTTHSVIEEIKDKGSREYLESHLFRMSVRNPQDEYVQQVNRVVKALLLYLSNTDVDVVALTLELTEELNEEWIGLDNISSDKAVKCLSKDNGVQNALNKLGLLNDAMYLEKKLKLRCYACSEMYDSHVDFCKICGYNTITRVTVVDTEDGEKVLLKKNYMPRQKVLKGPGGVEILSADQKEYLKLIKQREKALKFQSKFDFYEQ